MSEILKTIRKNGVLYVRHWLRHPEDSNRVREVWEPAKSDPSYQVALNKTINAADIFRSAISPKPTEG
jgi:hypothetical protein